MQTRITDAQGVPVYGFGGRYVIQVIAGIRISDELFENATGRRGFPGPLSRQAVVVKGAVTITPNIPLDPSAKETPNRYCVKRCCGIPKGLSLSVVVSLSRLSNRPPHGGFVFQVVSYFLFAPGDSRNRKNGNYV